MPHKGAARLATAPHRRDVNRQASPGMARMDDRELWLRELMAVFDELPPALRAAINYAPEPLDPKALATLCRRHGAANVLAMIELKLKRRGDAAPAAARSGR